MIYTVGCVDAKHLRCGILLILSEFCNIHLIYDNVTKISKFI